MHDFAVGRDDTSLLGRWWWSVDRLQLFALAVIIIIGAMLITAASPAVAQDLGIDTYHFVKRHLTFLPLAILVMLFLSLLNPKGIRRFSVLLYLGALAGVVLTLLIGTEIKGATRWLSLPGVSVQPSEFLKPAFAVISAWMFAYRPLSQNNCQDFGQFMRQMDGIKLSFGLLMLTICPLLMQPDLGMSLVICAIWGIQLFLTGLPLLWVAVLSGFFASGLVLAYLFLPHVTDRINRFLYPETTDNYQIEKAMEAFNNGGLLGVGPGQGTIKNLIPDAHADFVFAVAGEEFGVIACLIIVTLFGFIVIRGLARSMQQKSLFIMLAGAGLMSQFGFQAIINMASTLRLMPTKGMTLPFLSYGGSSMVALGIGMGMMLALTRLEIKD